MTACTPMIDFEPGATTRSAQLDEAAGRPQAMTDDTTKTPKGATAVDLNRFVEGACGDCHYGVGIGGVAMSTPMDPERLARLRSGEVTVADVVEMVPELIADRDHHARETERLRKQSDAEQGARGRMMHRLKNRDASIERLRGERDDAQREVCEGQAAALTHASPEGAAAFLGWPHLYPETGAPEGEQPTMPDPEDMHGAGDGFGGSDYP